MCTALCAAVCVCVVQGGFLFPCVFVEHKVLFDNSTADLKKLTYAAEGAAAFRVRRHGGQDAVSGACRGEHDIKVSWERTSTASALSQDYYLLHCEVHQGSPAHVTLRGLSPTAGIISGDFPQPEMIRWCVDKRAWLVISRTGSLNTDQPGPQRGCSLRASLFISSDNITQCAPVKAPSFIAYSDS